MSQPQQPYGNTPYGQNPYGQNPYVPNPYAPQQAPGYAPQQSQPGYGYQQPAGQPASDQQHGFQPTPPPAGFGQPPSLHTPVPAPVVKRAGIRAREVLCLTTDSVPGRDIIGVLGEVVGIIIRPPVKPVEAREQLAVYRQDAVDALAQYAQEAGADAVIGIRFETSLLDASATAEIAAYGTAVQLSPQPTIEEETPAQDVTARALEQQ